MISALLALLLAAPSPDALAVARKEYNRCLTAYMKTSVDKKVDVSAYDTGMSAACGAKETAFRNASIAVDAAAGIRRAAAEENAGLEIQDMRTNSLETFKDWAKNNAPQ
jgi:hypothetical protein